MYTNTKQTIAAPGLAEMLATLGSQNTGHPGDGWFTADEIASASGMPFTTIRDRCRKLVKIGTYETCKRTHNFTVTRFYRLAPGKCSTGADHVRPVRSSPTALGFRAKGKHAKKKE